MRDDSAADPDSSLAASEHVRANLAAKALVEALHGVGPKGRILTQRGLAGVSDVRAHGSLVVVDGVTEDGEAYRLATHYAALDYMIVLTDAEIDEDAELRDVSLEQGSVDSPERGES